MAVFTIVGLTLKEAWRRRTLVGAVLLGILLLTFTLLLILIKARMAYLVTTHDRNWDMERFETEYPSARILLTLMCLFFIRVLGMLFGLVLAGGAISGEIESGLLAVIMAKPIPRWQIITGKWLGMNLIAVASVLVWTAIVWLSLTLQTGVNLTQILSAGPYLAIYAVMSCTITLMFSTVFQRVLGTALTVIIAVTSWCDGVFNLLADHFDVPILNKIADFSCLLMPQGYVAWWVKDVTTDVARNPLLDSPARSMLLPRSSQLLHTWGQSHLNIGCLDAVYVGGYILFMLVLGILLFQRREIQG